MSNFNDYNDIKNLLTQKNIKFEVKLLNNKQLKINVYSEDDYRMLTRSLNDAKLEWHSYENKAVRPSKVIVRGLHPTCDPNEIVLELKTSGFMIENAVNLTKKVDNKIISLPLFMLTFDNKEDVSKIFKITNINHTKVKIEALRKRKDYIPQCKRCQRFGHTKKFCYREANCVKCAGKHLTEECKLSKTQTPKCANCQENHPANYRGCIVAKELQKRRALRNKKDKTPSIPTKPNIGQRKQIPNIAKEPKKTNSITPKQTLKYSDVVKSKKPTVEKTSPTENLIFATMEKMSKSLEKIWYRLEQLESRYPISHPKNRNHD